MVKLLIGSDSAINCPKIIILVSKRSQKQTADSNLKTKLNFSKKRKLKFKNQKTPIVTLLVTAIKTKNNTHLLLVVHMIDNMISY